MAKVSDEDMALMARLLGRGEAGEKGAARMALLLDTLNERDDEIGALRRELQRVQPHLCNKYLEDNLCGKPLGHEGDCEWFPF